MERGSSENSPASPSNAVPRILLVEEDKEQNTRKAPPEYQRAVAIEVWREEPNLAKIRRLLQQYDLNLLLFDAESGNSTLHRFAFLGCPDLLKLVLAAINSPDQQQQVAAAQHAGTGTSAINNPGGGMPANTAAVNNFSIDARNALSRTPLHIACEKNHRGIVEELLYQKADVNATTTGGSTPLHFACRADATSVVDVLLRQTDIIVDQEDNSRRTPLQVASNEYIQQKLTAHLDGPLDLSEFNA
ncbi:unnamed protein product [Amoebophrya sp. A120]|nr:unnamed protein product [Amoebophrya sp. A120]|eukprot:GSA120T00016599001.1